MIGQVENITKFGLFVRFSDENNSVSTDKKSVSKKTGLLRWSALPKGLPKFQKGDWIGIDISKIHEDGKIDLSYKDKDFKSTYGAFLESSSEKIEALKIKNRALQER